MALWEHGAWNTNNHVSVYMEPIVTKGKHAIGTRRCRSILGVAELDVKTHPDHPMASKLIDGEIPMDDFTASSAGTLFGGIGCLLIAAFLLPFSVIQWRGYDLDFSNGKFTWKPLE